MRTYINVYVYIYISLSLSLSSTEASWRPANSAKKGRAMAPALRPGAAASGAAGRPAVMI